MINRRRLLLTGLLLFLGGFLIPCLIGFLVGIIGVEENTRYHLLYYSFASGIAIAIPVGLPMMVIGIFARRNENKK